MRERSKFGIAIAAMIKIIATTINNSISEKPFSFLIILLSWEQCSVKSMLVRPGGVQPTILQGFCQIGSHRLLMEHIGLYIIDSIGCVGGREGMAGVLEVGLAGKSEIDNSWQLKLTRVVKGCRGVPILNSIRPG
jgi:hypothetical protein